MGLFSKLLKKLEDKRESTGKKEGIIIKEWDFEANDKITTSPHVLKTESSILFGTKKGTVYSLSYSGKKNWEYNLQASLSEEELFFKDSDAVNEITALSAYDSKESDEKLILVSSKIGSLYALDENGKLLWKYSCGDSIESGALAADINSDKKPEIIICSKDSFIYCLNIKGKLLWKYKAKSPLESIPSYLEKKIIFGSNDGTLYSLNENGKLLWTFKSKEKIIAEPILLDSGKKNKQIIVGSLDHNLYSLDLSGNLLWTYKTEGEILSKAVISDLTYDKKPEILFGSCDDKLHVVSDKGNKIWDYETNFWIVASPVIMDLNSDNAPEIILGSYDNYIYTLDSEKNFVLDYMPGISAITQQSGHYFDIMTKESGNYYGKLLWKNKLDSMITGIAPLGSSSKGFVVTKNSKKLDKFKYVKN